MDAGFQAMEKQDAFHENNETWILRHWKDDFRFTTNNHKKYVNLREHLLLSVEGAASDLDWWALTDVVI